MQRRAAWQQNLTPLGGGSTASNMARAVHRLDLNEVAFHHHIFLHHDFHA